MNSEDLTRLLRTWPESPEETPVRIIRAEDGRPVLQRRIEMGVVQMEIRGRPDGRTPGGFESILDAFRTRSITEDSALEDEELASALAEARQFLVRALALGSLGEIDAAGRDAAHARAVLAYGAASRRDADARLAAGIRAQAILLWVRAEVTRALKEHGSSRAIAAIDEGLAELGTFLGHLDVDSDARGPGAPGLLRALRASLVPKLPSSQREELRERLAAAIRAENFELAAILRDELRLLEH